MEGLLILLNVRWRHARREFCRLSESVKKFFFVFLRMTSILDQYERAKMTQVNI